MQRKNAQRCDLNYVSLTVLLNFQETISKQTCYANTTAAIYKQIVRKHLQLLLLYR